MGKKIIPRTVVLICDECGNEIPEGKGAKNRLTFVDTKKGVVVGDLCDPCASSVPGEKKGSSAPSGNYVCPTCHQHFETIQGVSTHHTRKHERSLTSDELAEVRGELVAA